MALVSSLVREGRLRSIFEKPLDRIAELRLDLRKANRVDHRPLGGSLAVAADRPHL
jgi:hypothetical protein